MPLLRPLLKNIGGASSQLHFDLPGLTSKQAGQNKLLFVPESGRRYEVPHDIVMNIGYHKITRQVHKFLGITLHHKDLF